MMATVPLVLMLQVCGDISRPDRLDVNVALPQIVQEPPCEVRVLWNGVWVVAFFP